ncbi:MAG TPA: helix-turn-helix domain-containing protein [Gammaproteobacteria bacterium]|nr:helix-turn-helix domain-containing protein [Gammaproteobacteria bacterium]
MDDTQYPAREIPRDITVRRAWIKFQLEIRGYSLAMLAREHGVSRQQPQAALYKPYPKWERIIAETLGLKPADLWPERYAPGARRRPGRPRKNHDTP